MKTLTNSDFDYSPKSIKEINIMLHQALTSVLMSSDSNEGTLTYDYNKHNVSDVLDEIEINYFGFEVDSDNHVSLLTDRELNNKPMLTDIQAYKLLTEKLNLIEF